LNLFFDSVYPALYFDHLVHDIGVGGLAAHSVGFTQHFLTDEIQLSSRLLFSR
jgi:hypothetical protein